jgi:superfamily II DNA or RNA helicase
MINISINNVYCQIIGLSDIQVIDKLDNALSFYIVGYQFSPAYKAHKWDGKKRLITSQLKFQTGLLPIVVEILQKSSIEYTLNDTRQDVVFGKEIRLNPNYYIPRDYQEQIVDVCLKEKCGLIKAATGSGKTLAISMLIAKTNIKTVVYVISLDLLYQTKAAIEEALGIECGIVGDGNCIIKKITIATPWSVANAYDKEYKPYDDEESKVGKEKLDQLSKIKIQKMVEGAQCFIIDEVQFLAASSFQLIANASKSARYRLGFSGTPWRDDGQDLALTAATGPQLIDINATILINRGVLVPPKIYFFEVPELPGFERWEKKPYPQVYDTYIVENETRNNMIIESVSKLHKNGRKILVLVKRKKHGIKLLEMMPKTISAYFLNGDATSEERQSVKDLFNANELDVIIASSIFDQGIDLPKLDALVLAGSGKSSTRALQRLGRVIRGAEGKKDALIADFVDQAPYIYNHSKARWTIYKTEEAFQIKLPEGIDW